MNTRPDHAWRPWTFHRVPSGWWEDFGAQVRANPNAEALIRLYMEELAEEFSVKSLDGWLKISAEQLGDTHRRRLHRFGGLLALLKWLHPTHDWANLASDKKKAVETKLVSFANELL